MKVEKTFEEKVKEDILKSGFPLEIYIMSILDEQGWIISPNEYFRDSETGKDAEIDIIATKPLLYVPPKGEKITDVKKSIYLTMIIECKSNPYKPKPWIFFMRNIKRFGVYKKIFPPFAFITANNFEGKKKFSFADKNIVSLNQIVNFQDLHQFEKKEEATTYRVAFSNHNEKDAGKEIYNALKSVYMRTRYEYLETEKYINLDNYKRFPDVFLQIIYPIIVFDGKIFEAKFEKGDIQLKDSKHIILKYKTRYNFEDENQVKNICVDVVSKDFFKEFLNLILRDHTALFNTLKNTRFTLSKL